MFLRSPSRHHLGTQGSPCRLEGRRRQGRSSKSLSWWPPRSMQRSSPRLCTSHNWRRWNHKIRQHPSLTRIACIEYQRDLTAIKWLVTKFLSVVEDSGHWSTSATEVLAFVTAEGWLRWELLEEGFTTVLTNTVRHCGSCSNGVGWRAVALREHGLNTPWVFGSEVVAGRDDGLVHGTGIDLALECEVVVEDEFGIREHPVSEHLIGSQGVGVPLRVMTWDFFSVNDRDGAQFLTRLEECGSKGDNAECQETYH